MTVQNLKSLAISKGHTIYWISKFKLWSFTTAWLKIPRMLWCIWYPNLDFILNILEIITLISKIKGNYTLLHTKCSASHSTPTIFTLNWESPPINFDDWAIEEIFTEHASINSSRHENNANFRISLNHITQHYQKEVSLLKHKHKWRNKWIKKSLLMRYT